MLREYHNKATLGQFIMHVGDEMFKGAGITAPLMKPINTFVFNKGGEQQVIIDEVKYTMPAHSVLPLMYNQHFVFEHPENLVAWQFNREFYCIVDHDAEVGCAGFLFYGIHHPMIISLTADERKGISLLNKLCVEDMVVKDTMQGEMLRTVLKRLIINITRLAKKNAAVGGKISADKFDLLRRFNMLLEQHFRTE